MAFTTAYNFESQEIARGQLASAVPCTIVSGVATAAIRFGAVVKYTAEENVVAAASAATDKIAGITLLDHTVETPDTVSGEAAVDATIPAGKAIRVLRKGEIGVQLKAGVSVAPGETAYMSVADNEITYTNVATNNLKVGVFKSKTAAGGVAVLIVDLPNV